jgi:hypothetical protein
MSQPKPLPDPIRASGAVVWRTGKGRRVEVLLIHRPKYDDWAMAARGESPFTANDEVDEVRWLPLGKAMEALSYERDVDVLRSFDAVAVARSA